MSAPVNFLDRTLRLIREELVDGVDDTTISNALSSTRILIRSDESAASSSSGQTAIVTSCLLMARCGLSVSFDVPDVDLNAPQPPLHGRRLASALDEFSKELRGVLHLSKGQPTERPTAAFTLGDVQADCNADTEHHFRYGRWWGGLGTSTVSPNIDQPFGAMVSAALAASEAFKHGIRRLRSLARDRDIFEQQFPLICASEISLAPETMTLIHDLGRVDIVSAGAVSNAALFALLRIPQVSGAIRVIEHDTYDYTNHNRCMLMTSTSPGQRKAVDVAAFRTERLRIMPITSSFQEAQHTGMLGPLAERVIVGVDDIPTRWDVQLAAPAWLAIGATTHWSALSSFHIAHGACARCLHPRDDADVGYAPTISFVSFWAGLWNAAHLIRSLATVATNSEWIFLTPTRLAGASDLWASIVQKNRLCPVHADNTRGSV